MKTPEPNETLLQENTRLLCLVAAQKEYIALLGAEISDLMGFASIHGWRSYRYEAGVAAREKIAKYHETQS